jgi:hypothetical protein
MGNVYTYMKYKLHIALRSFNKLFGTELGV